MTKKELIEELIQIQIAIEGNDNCEYSNERVMEDMIDLLLEYIDDDAITESFNDAYEKLG